MKEISLNKDKNNKAEEISQIKICFSAYNYNNTILTYNLWTFVLKFSVRPKILAKLVDFLLIRNISPVKTEKSPFKVIYNVLKQKEF